jgi:hypothetical protein
MTALDILDSNPDAKDLLFKFDKLSPRSRKELMSFLDFLL